MNPDMSHGPDEIQRIIWLIDEGGTHPKLTEAIDRLKALRAELDAIPHKAPDGSIDWHKWVGTLTAKLDEALAAALDKATRQCDPEHKRFVDAERNEAQTVAALASERAKREWARDLGFLVQAWAQDNKIILGPHSAADLANRLATRPAPDAPALREALYRDICGVLAADGGYRIDEIDGAEIKELIANFTHALLATPPRDATVMADPPRRLGPLGSASNPLNEVPEPPQDAPGEPEVGR